MVVLLDDEHVEEVEELVEEEEVVEVSVKPVRISDIAIKLIFVL